MARYIAENDIYELFQPRGIANLHVSHIDVLPRADVVPRAEVASMFEDLMKEVRAIADYYEKSANETADVIYTRVDCRGAQKGALLALLKISRLQDKYIGDSK